MGSRREEGMEIWVSFTGLYLAFLDLRVKEERFQNGRFDESKGSGSTASELRGKEEEFDPSPEFLVRGRTESNFGYNTEIQEFPFGDEREAPGSGVLTFIGVCALENAPAMGVWARENRPRSASPYIASRKELALDNVASEGSDACSAASKL